MTIWFSLQKKNIASNLRRIQADISALPLESESVDVAISVSVLEHLPIDKRLAAISQIERVLKRGGRALISIGNLMNVTSEAQALLQRLPFFTERGCAVYFPIDLSVLLKAAPLLKLMSTGDLEFFPGYKSFNEKILLDDKNLVVEAYRDIPELADYPSVRSIVVCEIGIELQKK